MNSNDNLSFSGTLETKDSDENLLENVELKILKGHYECTTSLPFGHGAGKLEVSGNTINFIDTTSVVIPAIFGPSYVLSGEHMYKFNGDVLEIWREKNVGIIKYRLTLTK